MCTEELFTVGGASDTKAPLSDFRVSVVLFALRHFPETHTLKTVTEWAGKYYAVFVLMTPSCKVLQGASRLGHPFANLASPHFLPERQKCGIQMMRTNSSLAAGDFKPVWNRSVHPVPDWNRSGTSCTGLKSIVSNGYQIWRNVERIWNNMENYGTIWNESGTSRTGLESIRYIPYRDRIWNNMEQYGMNPVHPVRGSRGVTCVSHDD